MNWRSLIEDGDAEKLWNSLHKLVSRSLSATENVRREGNAADLSSSLTQELFLELISEHCLDRYIENGHSSAEIESELLLVEIPRLVFARKRDPGSLALAEINSASRR